MKKKWHLSDIKTHMLSISQKQVIKIKNRTSLRTRKQNTWACNIWDEWATWRNTQGNNHMLYKHGWIINEMLNGFLDEVKLGFWLAKFVLEIKRKDGKDYPPQTLRQICSIIQRALRNGQYGQNCNLEIFNKKDRHFYHFFASLVCKMKKLTSEGIGVVTKSASPISQEDEEKLWETGTINLNTSFGLSNGVFLYNCKRFGLRAMDEHRKLTPEQYSFNIDAVTGRQKMTFNGRLNKNNQGGIKLRNIKLKTIDQFHYPTNPRCAVTLFKHYLECIPKDGVFYRSLLIV